MNKQIVSRVNAVAEYIIKTKDTIRNAAKSFNVSKSTIHKDIQERLKVIDLEKYQQIEKIFKEHIEVRHILGGQSTKVKYQQLKQSNGG